MALSTKARARSLSVLAAFISLAMALLIAEFAVRTIAPQPIGNALPMYEPDSLCGHRLKTGFSGRLRSGEFNVRVRINSRGFRGDEWCFESLHRILILGDSFTFGYGVEEDDTYSSVLERSLREENCGATVYNAGIPGYGTVQEYSLLTELYDIIRPQLVILAYTVGSDLRDTIEFLFSPEQGLEVRDGYLVKKSLPRGSRLGIKAYLQERSHLYVMLQRSKAILAMGGDDHLVPEPCDHFLARNPCGNSGAGWRETTRYLGQMAEYCSERGSIFMILAIPHPVQTDDDLWAGEIDRVEDASDAWSREATQDRLKDLASKIDCRFVDPLDRFRSWNDTSLYFTIDRHINRNGHELIAEELLQSIKAIIECNNYNDG